MIYIESLVKKLLPEICQNQKLSIVCLVTSNPVYLVFIENSCSPDLVVRISSSADICLAHQVTESLYKILGDLIPQPLLQVKTNGRNIAIQKGVNGCPWFQLACKYSTTAQKEKIYIRAIEALNKLHQAVSASSDWNEVISPSRELRKTYQQCLDSGTALPVGTDKLLQQSCTSLDGLGEISVFPQHGDFCLNNLIIDDTKIHIIDFEDFGMTCMPLHDQFTLALSFHQLLPQSGRGTISGAINACINDALAPTLQDASILHGLFLHHLLLRLGAWSQSEKRIQYRQWLLSILENFIHSPDDVFKKMTVVSKCKIDSPNHQCSS